MDKEKILKNIEEIEEQFKNFYITFELLSAYIQVIEPLTTEDLKKSNIDNNTLISFWDKTKNGEKLYDLVNLITSDTFSDLEIIYFDTIQELKTVIKDIQ
mgnify:FL=1